MIHLFWLIHLSFGALTDSRMWGEKKDDPNWLKRYTDIFWLGWYCLSPFVVAWLALRGVPILSIQSAIAGFGLSVAWDMIYSKVEHGQWIYPLSVWLDIPTPWGRKVIGFKTMTSMLYFDLFRMYLIYVSLII